MTLCGLGQVAGLTGSPLGQRSRVFTSRTPFVLPRHRKRGDEPEDQLVRELRLRGLPTRFTLRACMDSSRRHNRCFRGRSL